MWRAGRPGEHWHCLAAAWHCLEPPPASQPRPSSILRPGHWHGHTALQPHSAMVYSLTQNKATCLYAKLEDGCRCELRIFRIFWTSSNDGLVPYSVFTFQWIMWIKQHRVTQGRVTSWTPPPCTLTKLTLSDTRGCSLEFFDFIIAILK